MAEYECICKYCAFADACPSAYFPPDNMKCADLRDMRRSTDNTRTPKERGGEKWSEKRRNESITENVVSAESDTNKAK